MQRRLLVCADTLPWPPDRGDRLRYSHFVGVLRKDHHVRLALVRRANEALERPAGDETDLTLSRSRVAVNAARGLFSPVPMQFSAFADRTAGRSLAAAAAGCDAFVALGARAGLYRHSFPAAGPAILDLQDSLVLNSRAQWRGAAGMLRKLYGGENLLKARLFESRLVRRYDLVLVAGNADHRWVRSRHPEVSCELVPTAVPVPPGPAEPGEKPLLLFLGDLRFAPNVDAVRYLVEEIWPRVKSRCRGASLRIVGHAPERRLARRLEGLDVETAYSVPDVQPHLAAARAFVAPMRIGSGVKVKVLQAMAAARPVVMTPLANDGVGATNGLDAIVAEGPDELAAGAAALLADDGTARAMGRAGWELVAARFSTDAVAAQLRAAVAGVLGG